MRNSEVVVYSRPGCHLCDDAKELLERYGCSPKVINIDDHATLKEQYGLSIPVVFINGEERFRGRINEVLLRRLLR